MTPGKERISAQAQPAHSQRFLPDQQRYAFQSRELVPRYIRLAAIRSTKGWCCRPFYILG